MSCWGLDGHFIGDGDRALADVIERRCDHFDTEVRPRDAEQLLHRVMAASSPIAVSAAAEILVRMRAAALLSTAALTKLDLSNVRVHDNLLAELAACTTLTRLDLAGTRAGGADLSYLGGLPLVWLSLSVTKLRGSGLDDLVAIQTLEHLDVSFTEVRPEQLLALRTLGRLRVLDIRGIAARADDVAFVRTVLPGVEVIAEDFNPG